MEMHEVPDTDTRPNRPPRSKIHVVSVEDHLDWARNLLARAGPHHVTQQVYCKPSCFKAKGIGALNQRGVLHGMVDRAARGNVNK